MQHVVAPLAQKDTDLERYIYLINLLDHNKPCFTERCVGPGAFLPIVYDPTIREACLKFGLFIGPRAACISRRHTAVRSKTC